jgi:formylglycine-generating enzyme required for sulfatase activity
MILVYVPAGEFTMGSDSEESALDERPVHVVYLDAFWIDRTEITNAMFAACVQAEACRAIAHPRADMADHPDYPAQGVPWTAAVAYCEWVGRRLPTEAEWEKAARGTDGRIYPWGNQAPTGELANFEKIFGDVADPGSFPTGASPNGSLDMAGNVYEWVQDWYGPDYYVESPAANPAGPEGGMQRVLRGGAWNSQTNNLRSANRFWAFPGRNDFDGFRCAMDGE